MKPEGIAAVLGGLSLLLVVAAGAAPTDSFTAQYAVGNGAQTVGSAELTLTAGDEQWKLSLETRPGGLLKLFGRGRIVEHSTGVWAHNADTAHPIPISTAYTFHEKGGKAARNLTADFAHSGHLVRFDAENGVGDSLASESPIFDPLSSMLLNMSRIASGEPTVRTLTLFQRGSLREVSLDDMGEESVETRAGTFATRHIHRRQQGSSRELHLWYSLEAPYLPVVIEQHRKGKLVARLTLKKLEK